MTDVTPLIEIFCGAIDHVYARQVGPTGRCLCGRVEYREHKTPPPVTTCVTCGCLVLAIEMHERDEPLIPERLGHEPYVCTRRTEHTFTLHPCGHHDSYQYIV